MCIERDSTNNLDTKIWVAEICSLIKIEMESTRNSNERLIWSRQSRCVPTIKKGGLYWRHGNAFVRNKSNWRALKILGKDQVHDTRNDERASFLSKEDFGERIEKLNEQVNFHPAE